VENQTCKERYLRWYRSEAGGSKINLKKNILGRLFMKLLIVALFVLLITGCDDNPSYTDKDIKTVCEEVQHNLGLSSGETDYFASIMEMNGIEPPNASRTGMIDLVTKIRTAELMGKIRGQLFVPSCFNALKKELSNPK
jgi:hypothetical protein